MLSNGLVSFLSRASCFLLLKTWIDPAPNCRHPMLHPMLQFFPCEVPICHLGSWSLCFHAGLTAAFARAFDAASSQVSLSALQAPAHEARNSGVSFSHRLRGPKHCLCSAQGVNLYPYCICNRLKYVMNFQKQYKNIVIVCYSCT